MRLVLALCAVFALTVGVAAATADQGGNSANAQACQQGGWMNLQGSDGTQFANQGQCVSFGAQGGTIVPIPPSVVTVSVTPNATLGFCNVTANLSHFAPNTAYTLAVTVGFLPSGTIFDFHPTTDSSGAASVTFSLLESNTSWEAEASVGSVSSPPVPFSC
jgi:hypothetical protein